MIVYCRYYHRYAYFRYFIANIAYLMTLWLIGHTCFISRSITEIMPYNDAQFLKEFQRIEQCSPADREMCIVEFLFQLLNRKMSLDVVYCIEYGISLWSFPAIALLYVGIKFSVCFFPYAAVHIYA